jgi:hypothetical protein
MVPCPRSKWGLDQGPREEALSILLPQSWLYVNLNLRDGLEKRPSCTLCYTGWLCSCLVLCSFVCTIWRKVAMVWYMYVLCVHVKGWWFGIEVALHTLKWAQPSLFWQVSQGLNLEVRDMRLSTTQCTIHWKPVMTQSNMNDNWVINVESTLVIYLVNHPTFPFPYLGSSIDE